VEQALPDSYLELKRGIIGDEVNQTALKRSWASLTDRLAFLADDIEKRQQAVGANPCWIMFELIGSVYRKLGMKSW
jgi:hypothetical protein